MLCINDSVHKRFRYSSSRRVALNCFMYMFIFYLLNCLNVLYACVVIQTVRRVHANLSERSMTCVLWKPMLLSAAFVIFEVCCGQGDKLVIIRSWCMWQMW